MRHEFVLQCYTGDDKLIKKSGTIRKTARWKISALGDDAQLRALTRVNAVPKPPSSARGGNTLTASISAVVEDQGQHTYSVGVERRKAHLAGDSVKGFHPVRDAEGAHGSDKEHKRVCFNRAESLEALLRWLNQP